MSFFPKKKIKNFISSQTVFVALGLILILILSLKPAYDPDMGWHLKDGEYLLNHQLQVPKTDIYSYTMPNFPFVMHEWLTDVGMYLIYKYLGISVLSVLFALIAAAAFFITSLAVPTKREYQIIAAIIGCIASITIIGVRPQMITLLFLAFLLNILYRFRNNPKTKIIYFLPLLFLVWVNLHGGFPSGLVVLGLFLFFELAKKIIVYLYYHRKHWYLGRKRKSLPNFILSLSQKIKQKNINLREISWPSWRKIFLFSFFSGLVTLINPYSWRIYIEVITTITDSYLKHNIQEWVPVSLSSSQAHRLLTYLGLLLILTLLSIKKVDFTHVGISAVFTWFAFSSWRNVPLFIVISIPLWVYIVQGLVAESLAKIIKNKLILGLFLFGVVIISYQYRQTFFTIFSSQNYQAMLSRSYPVAAVQYLKNNPQEGNMFNDYDWGGYLIWQYPEKKVFIDGRMPSWRQNGEHVFADHQNIVSVQKNYQELLKKYDISWVIIRKNSVQAFALASDKWEVVYQDDFAVILKKPK